jgi:NAD(P)-dependent dehydrogenase (short-subunit alcohol dehydrogenase family)
VNPGANKYFQRNCNVIASVFTVQKALPLFQDGGSIILTGAGSASKGFAGFSVYSAIRSFACSWTVDPKNRKIRVNSISPGPIDTLAVRLSISEQLKKNILSTVPLGRMGNPEEVAKAVAFLASNDSSYITGIE